MTSCPMDRTVRKAAAGSPPTSRSTTRPRRMSDVRAARLYLARDGVRPRHHRAAGGCAVAVHSARDVAVAAAGLRIADRGTSENRSQCRDPAPDQRRHAGRCGGARDPLRRVAGSRSCIPDDVRFDALLPQTCRRQAALSTISFFANGTSCGGAIALTRFDVGYEIRVNWLTGRIEIAPRDIASN